MSQTDLSVEQQVKQFFEAYPPKKFAKNEIIIFGDKTVPPVNYLISGKVAQYDISDSGNKLVINVFKPGAFFPMSHAVNNLPNSYFFEAMEPVVVKQAPPSKVVDFLRRSPDVLFDLLKRVYRGTDGLLGRLLLLMDGSAQSLLLFELNILAQRFGQPENSGIFISTTAGQIATQTGLARETVSRELQKCAAKGLLEVKKGGVLLKPQP